MVYNATWAVGVRTYSQSSVRIPQYLKGLAYIQMACGYLPVSKAARTGAHKGKDIRSTLGCYHDCSISYTAIRDYLVNIPQEPGLCKMLKGGN
jgi:bacterioferritin-associated ferredoxin